jgi:hypothetical protein
MARVQVIVDSLLTGCAQLTGVLHLIRFYFILLFFLCREYSGRGHQQRQKSRIYCREIIDTENMNLKSSFS